MYSLEKLCGPTPWNCGVSMTRMLSFTLPSSSGSFHMAPSGAHESAWYSGGRGTNMIMFLMQVPRPDQLWVRNGRVLISAVARWKTGFFSTPRSSTATFFSLDPDLDHLGPDRLFEGRRRRQIVPDVGLDPDHIVRARPRVSRLRGRRRPRRGRSSRG